MIFWILLRLAILAAKYWIHAEKKNFQPPLFMTFLYVFEVPELEKAIKNFVSVCLCVCVCVNTISPLTDVVESSFWCQNLGNLKMKSWKAFEHCNVTQTWHAWQKRYFFRGFLQFSSLSWYKHNTNVTYYCSWCKYASIDA